MTSQPPTPASTNHPSKETHVDTMSDVMADVNGAEFESQVLARSHEVPVLVDFWADWCGPCRMLMPLLAQLAQEYNGKFFLAKVNSDQEQALATHYGVRSLPTVKLFRHGEVVDEFMGVQPEASLRQFIDPHIARPSDAHRQQAQQLIAAGDLEGALSCLHQARDLEPDNPQVMLDLASLYSQRGEFEAANELIKQLPVDQVANPQVKALMARIELGLQGSDAPSPEALHKRLRENEADLEAHYQLSLIAIGDQAYETAMAHLLEIVRLDRGYKDDIGRKTLLQVFELLGNDGDLVNQYRRKLSSLLY